MADTEWTQRAGMDSVSDSVTVATYAAQAEAARDAAQGFEAGAEAAEANAAASAAAAAQDATDAATSETNAATSEANAAASETAAAASETAAATSETNAATSETNAATSETNATASAAAALASQGAAATSEANAAASEAGAEAAADRAEAAAASVSLEVADYAALDALTGGVNVGENVRRTDIDQLYTRVNSGGHITATAGLSFDVVGDVAPMSAFGGDNHNLLVQRAFDWSHDTGGKLVLDGDFTLTTNIFAGHLHLSDGGGSITCQSDENFVRDNRSGNLGNLSAIVPYHGWSGGAGYRGATRFDRFVVKIERGVKINLVRNHDTLGPRYPWAFYLTDHGSYCYADWRSVWGDASGLVYLSNINGPDIAFGNRMRFGGSVYIENRTKTAPGGFWVRHILGEGAGVPTGTDRTTWPRGEDWASDIYLDYPRVEKVGGTDEAMAIFTHMSSPENDWIKVRGSVDVVGGNGFGLSILNNTNAPSERFNVHLTNVDATVGGALPSGELSGMKSHQSCLKLWLCDSRIDKATVKLTEVEDANTSNISLVKAQYDQYLRTDAAGYPAGSTRINVVAGGAGRLIAGQEVKFDGFDTVYEITEVFSQSGTLWLDGGSNGWVDITPALVEDLPAETQTFRVPRKCGLPSIGHLTAIVDGVLQNEAGSGISSVTEGSIIIEDGFARITEGSTEPDHSHLANLNGSVKGGRWTVGSVSALERVREVTGGVIQGQARNCSHFAADHIIDPSKHDTAFALDGGMTVMTNKYIATYHPKSLRQVGSGALSRVVTVGSTGAVPSLAADVKYVLDCSENPNLPTNFDSADGYIEAYDAVIWDGTTRSRRSKRLRVVETRAVRKAVTFDTTGTGLLTHDMGVQPLLAVLEFAPGALVSISEGLRVKVTSLGATQLTLRIVDVDGSFYLPSSSVTGDVMGFISTGNLQL